jgi:hypothetical protein
MRFLAVITLLILALAIAQPVAAQSFKPDYNAGIKAYFKYDYATELRHWRPLAEQGNVRAKCCLGKTMKDCTGSDPKPLWAICLTVSGCRRCYHP